MLILIIHLYIKSGALDGFREYESRALRILSDYGGEVLAAFTPASLEEGAPDDLPDEIHVLRMPDMDAFRSFRQDERLIALRPLRDQVIERSTIVASDELLHYGV